VGWVEPSPDFNRAGFFKIAFDRRDAVNRLLLPMLVTACFAVATPSSGWK